MPAYKSDSSHRRSLLRLAAAAALAGLYPARVLMDMTRDLTAEPTCPASATVVTGEQSSASSHTG